jgi:hypothetical protein
VFGVGGGVLSDLFGVSEAIGQDGGLRVLQIAGRRTRLVALEQRHAEQRSAIVSGS